MDKNMVRVGDKVKKGQQIGTVGNGNKWSAKGIINLLFKGKMSAHLHYDISRKEIKQEYVIGWTKAQVHMQMQKKKNINLTMLHSVIISVGIGWIISETGIILVLI
jgi:murein DD-endopeptidase MepM/ murein hydrolase activator NlpD